MSAPDSTAVRVALWRALHTEIDAAPPVLEDTVGLALAAPPAGWRSRPDMHPAGTRGYRASIVARARFLEDLVAASGTSQYVLLGAGLDTFAQRHPELLPRLTVYEVDQAETQRWKERRLRELGFGVPPGLRLVPVDFEKDSLAERLAAAGFDRSRPAVVASAGVSLYLTRDAVAATLREAASLAAGSTFAMTYLLPAELVDEPEREAFRMVMERARAAGTPFRSLFTPDDIAALARGCGFARVRNVTRDDLYRRYFAGRADRLAPGSGEEILVAETGTPLAPPPA